MTLTHHQTTMRTVRTVLTAAITLAAAILMLIPSPAWAGGQARATAAMRGVVSGSGVLIEFNCLAEGEGDGSARPDPHRVRVDCALSNGEQSWTAVPAESFLVPTAATASTAFIPFGQLRGLELCSTATVEFADTSTATDTDCVGDVDTAIFLPV